MPIGQEKTRVTKRKMEEINGERVEGVKPNTPTARSNTPTARGDS